MINGLVILWELVNFLGPPVLAWYLIWRLLSSRLQDKSIR